MSKGKNATTKPSPEDAVLAAVEANPGATTEGIGRSADVARSTASKALARLADARKVVRHEGRREKGKRLPDRWTVSGVEMSTAYAAHVKSPATAGGKATRPAASKPAGKAGTKAAAPKAAPSAAGGKLAAAGKGGAPKASNAGKGERPNQQQERLKAFGLDPLVLAYVEEHADSGPHGPAAVAKAIERSSGAVANCMKRLAEKDKLRKVSDKPLRYEKIAA